jgi:hypothetical protein
MLRSTFIKLVGCFSVACALATNVIILSTWERNSSNMERLLDREVRPILLNISPNCRKLALALVNAMRKIFERVVVDGTAEIDEVVL